MPEDVVEPPHERRSCGLLIVRGDPPAEFLLMEHDHRWDLPKGHVDPGESDRDCALRELEEETGIRSDDIQIDPVFRFELRYRLPPRETDAPSTMKTLVIFLARLVREVAIVPTEHRGFCWFQWQPPHQIQEQTIDPLLEAVEAHLAG